jgi:hypothetical protein
MRQKPATLSVGIEKTGYSPLRRVWEQNQAEVECPRIQIAPRSKASTPNALSCSLTNVEHRCAPLALAPNDEVSLLEPISSDVPPRPLPKPLGLAVA